MNTLSLFYDSGQWEPPPEIPKDLIFNELRNKNALTRVHVMQVQGKCEITGAHRARTRFVIRERLKNILHWHASRVTSVALPTPLYPLAPSPP